MPLFLANWKLIGTGIAILAVFLSGWTVNGWRWQGKLETAVEAQKNTDNLECAKDKLITTEVSNDYQDQIADLNKRVATLRMRPARCIMLTSSATAGRDGSAGGRLAGQDGVTSTDFIQYASDSETYRLRLVACQTFIRETWKAKGQ